MLKEMNKNYFYTLLVVFALSFAACAKAAIGSEVQKETFVFAIKGQDTLSLDKYEVKSEQVSQLKPVVLFAFGGGFKAGDKARQDYIPFFDFLAENGYVVVSTDYRTALKNPNPEQLSTMAGLVASLQNAISIAVEDFFDATHYIVKHSKEWNVNPEQIIASGSSAGAITSLQAEYEICNQTELTKHLPTSFNYAGVVSFAGAICNTGTLQWNKVPCPMMLFHGDADRTVPYEKAIVDNMGAIWGSAAIVQQLEKMNASYYFYKVENAGHVIADSPFKENKYDILGFLEKQVLKKQKYAIIVDEKVPGAKAEKKDFTITDYIQNNMN